MGGHGHIFLQFAFASFRNESRQRQARNRVYNENFERIRKNALTTFEIVFVQNIKQTIA